MVVDSNESWNGVVIFFRIPLFCVIGFVQCACPAGRWGSTCVRICEAGCQNNTCNQYGGECSFGCQEGFYEITSRYDRNCKACPENCKRCRDSELCHECVDGRFGEKCDRFCGFNCMRCVAKWSGAPYAECIECLPNYYGYNCMFNCSYCVEGMCSRDNCIKGCIRGWVEYQSRMCVRCYDTCETCDPWSWKSQKCLSCPPGTWGNLCDNMCPNKCANNTCNQGTGHCECLIGHYLDTENNVCKKCPDGCLECDSATNCTKCSRGKYGTACDHSCVAHCLECGPEPVYNDYRKMLEYCTECEKGYYLRGRCYPCDEGCSDCWWMHNSMELECRSCVDGYYQDKMATRLIMKCFKCPQGCRKCNLYGECLSCFDGYFHFEQTCCPNNCVGCSSPTSCTGCRPGYFGDTCNTTCNENCQTCNAGDFCNTCKAGRYSINKLSHEKLCECSVPQCETHGDDGNCSECKEQGWYPKMAGCCQCRKCKGLKCDKNGNCLNGCMSPGIFGSKCDLSCRDHKCAICTGENVQTIKCTECLSNHEYVSDGKCVGCSENCRNGICGKGGLCHGCKDGWAGDQCSFECGERCKVKCEQSGCPVCKDGYFRENCNEQCSEGCLKSLCRRTDGRCTIGCIEDFYGLRCDVRKYAETSEEVSGPRNYSPAISPAYNVVLLLTVIII